MNVKMTRPWEFGIVLSLCLSVFAKELHIKQTLEAKNEELKGFMNIFNNQDILKNDRSYPTYIVVDVQSNWIQLNTYLTKSGYLPDLHNPLDRPVRLLTLCLRAPPFVVYEVVKSDVQLLFATKFARHVKAVTESVLDHLIDEIKHQYFRGSYNKHSPIPQLIRNLNKELQRNERNKLHREKERKKNANKKNNKIVKKKPKMTTVKPT